MLYCWGLSSQPPSLSNPALCHVHAMGPKNKCEHEERCLSVLWVREPQLIYSLFMTAGWVVG